MKEIKKTIGGLGIYTVHAHAEFGHKAIFVMNISAPTPCFNDFSKVDAMSNIESIFNINDFSEVDVINAASGNSDYVVKVIAFSEKIAEEKAIQIIIKHIKDNCL